MITGVYAILNIINCKLYVGSAQDVRLRWNNHKYNLRLNKHPNKHLQASWNSYGERAFEFILLELLPISLLEKHEEDFIKKYNTAHKDYGYNIRKEVDSNRGIKASKKTRKLMSKMLIARWKHYRKEHPESIIIKICICGNKITGEPAIVKKRKYCSTECALKNKIIWNEGRINVYSKNTLKLMSKAKKGISIGIGHKVSKETRLKISKKLLGRKISRKIALKISKTLKGRKLSQEHKNKIRLAKLQFERLKGK